VTVVYEKSEKEVVSLCGIKYMPVSSSSSSSMVSIYCTSDIEGCDPYTPILTLGSYNVTIEQVYWRKLSLAFSLE
jgi:hypothetical protein